jgi:hypothetical protein
MKRFIITTSLALSLLSAPLAFAWGPRGDYSDYDRIQERMEREHDQQREEWRDQQRQSEEQLEQFDRMQRWQDDQQRQFRDMQRWLGQ